MSYDIDCYIDPAMSCSTALTESQPASGANSEWVARIPASGPASPYDSLLMPWPSPTFNLPPSLTTLCTL
eukprot:217132-Pelagomonas_calceolata.AAC.1